MKVQRGRLDGTDCNGVAEAVCPSKGEPGVVGSVEAASLRTTPSLAREARPESSRHATTLGRGRSPDRPEEREGTSTDPGRPKDGETHPRRRPGDPGQASNTGAALRSGRSQTGRLTDCPTHEEVLSPPEGGETTLSLQLARDG